MHNRVGVISLGCAKNRVNSEQMMFLLSSAGYHVSGETDSADVVLVNTCGFIESAKSEAIEVILEFVALKESGKIKKLVVAGCLPQRYKDIILKELPEIDAVVGTGSFDDIVDVVDKLLHSPPSKGIEYFGDINAKISEAARINTTSPSWTYLKIADGCDNRCAYCCIADIRGRYRSRPLENIVSEATALVNSGIRELILVAQDLTSYGHDIYGKRRLSDLLKALSNIDKLKWIRLHYMYPSEIDEEIIDVIAKSDKIVKYLDIPIQHISDNVLKKMRRRGSGEDIKALFTRLRERIPGVVLRTSLIAGLPGEGEKEFNELCEFLKEMKIELVGVFTYSPEEGTDAALMERPPREVAKRRAEQILQLQTHVIQSWNESRIGSVTAVLIESLEYGVWKAENRKWDVGSGEILFGRSFAESPDVDGYIRVKTDRPFECLDFIDVRITGIENGELVGEPV
ncbi:MAG: 30S ribosomal protein S12 methylthiotransferase RimO [Oscillospiraceae bacterium]|jgi:ribosomal protein S12 methylthiotransferase|nr:30S ribosomal protein S12 methylthiotransferase RimO [Oscillospiraceae bacterium]